MTNGRVEMPSGNAFLDTTILVDATLKDQDRRDAVRVGLARFENSILPTYAMKEFRAGPLDTYVWFLNLLKRTGTLARAVERAALESAYRQNRLRTSVELQSRLLIECFPKGESPEESGDRMWRLLRKIIAMAWKSRLTLATRRTAQLRCFSESAPGTGEDGLMVLDPPSCRKGHSCELAEHLRTRPNDISILLAIVAKAPNKAENKRRAKSLNRLLDVDADFFDSHCRSLGDAVFALTAPPDAIVLTTNIHDRKPLAEALGKRAETLTPPTP